MRMHRVVVRSRSMGETRGCVEAPFRRGRAGKEKREVSICVSGYEVASSVDDAEVSGAGTVRRRGFQREGTVYPCG